MGRMSQRQQVLGSIPINPDDCTGMFIDPLTIEYRANMTEAPKYSLDSKPSWLPAGWDMERAMDMTQSDWKHLTEQQQDVLRAGLEAYCGTEFKDEVFKDMFERPEKQTDDNNPPTLPPNFMKPLERYHATGNWGFVFYRTTYEGGEEQWSLVQQRLNTMIESVFDYYSNIDGVNEARQRWKLHWIDDPQKFDQMSPQDIAENYRSAFETLPENYQHSMCFAVDHASAHSILLADITRMQKRPRLGDVVPFVVAIDQYLGWKEPDAQEEDFEEDLENWSGPFRAHPASIVDGIFTIVALQIMQTYEFAYHAKGTNGVWWDSYGGVWTVTSDGRYAEPLFEDAALLRAEYREKKKPNPSNY
ncbi:hypothetical protein BGW36DRAFT_354976 [Talaromyces proteolyticus]|uniref:Uncharacterized protein n=1 Tax=Talaromyces proteolyticus TaxID=1131652 RepID=A0AAD4L0S8_9EURO|nr:uncharacterized protein BGW36DRAFT_354976 [Talaromyces proteolyticus]KAH8703561.1 hypothetical protein BGW36DRAFT_354976 [Talaromyces proteolyticus]